MPQFNLGIVFELLELFPVNVDVSFAAEKAACVNESAS